MDRLVKFAGLLLLASAFVLGFRGCFDAEPQGIGEGEWDSIGVVSRNGFYVFGGILERFNEFSVKQREIQSETQCAGAQDVNCDGVVDDGEGTL